MLQQKTHLSEFAPQPPTFNPSDRDTPLWMITKKPILNNFVRRLQQLRTALSDPAEHATINPIRFSRAELEDVHAAFKEMILGGEQQLHRLCRLMCQRFFEDYQLDSVVIGEINQTHERFKISQQLSREELYKTTDIDLGTRQINKLYFDCDQAELSRASLVANMVEYQPTEMNSHGIHKIVSRIKAEEELWNKVVDEIFGLDNLVQKDKQLKKLSFYVKDVFGIKIVVGEDNDVNSIHNMVRNLCWKDAELHEAEVAVSPQARRLKLLETKDYTANGWVKKSGWQGLKSVVRWEGKTFEIQVQPLRVYLRERERLTDESHTSFKRNRDQIREEVAKQDPLFGFYQKLLRSLFLDIDSLPPGYDGVDVVLED